MSNRIRWEDKTPGNGDVYNIACIGYAGAVDEPAFIIYTPDELHADWLLSVRLIPGSQFLYAASADDLKAEAERWLSGFVSSLGAVFPEAAQVPQRPGKRTLTTVDVLDSFRTVTNWSDAEVLHYECCDECDPFASVVCEDYQLAVMPPQAPDTAATAGETE